MDLNSTYLVGKDDNYFMFDRSMCMPVVISKRVYDIITALKNNTEKEKLYIDFGEDIVKNVVSGIANLREKYHEEMNTKSYENTLNIISGYAKEKISLVNLVLMIAQDCNISCRYCFGDKSGQYGSKGLMSKQMAERCFDYYLSNLGGEKELNVLFFGGEPLLNMEAVRHIIELWEKRKHNYPDKSLSFSLVTNGILLTPEIIKYFIEKEVRITVSLDGPKDIHDANRVYRNGQGTFDSVMSGIEMLRNYNKSFCVKVTTNRYTRYDELYDFLSNQNFDITFISQVDQPMLETEVDYQMDVNMFGQYAKWQQELMCEGCNDVRNGKRKTFAAKQFFAGLDGLRQNKKGFPYKCIAGWHIATFSADGRLFLCKSFVGQDQFCIGNINTGIDKEKVVKLYKDFLNASKDCDNCWALSVCERGCYLQKSNPNGGFNPLPEAICNIFRDRFAATMARTVEFRKYENA